MCETVCLGKKTTRLQREEGAWDRIVMGDWGGCEANIGRDKDSNQCGIEKMDFEITEIEPT